MRVDRIQRKTGLTVADVGAERPRRARCRKHDATASIRAEVVIGITE